MSEGMYDADGGIVITGGITDEDFERLAIVMPDYAFARRDEHGFIRFGQLAYIGEDLDGSAELTIEEDCEARADAVLRIVRIVITMFGPARCSGAIYVTTDSHRTYGIGVVDGELVEETGITSTTYEQLPPVTHDRS